MSPSYPVGLRSWLALVPPLVALLLQWLLWPWLRPFAWLLFYPAVFFSSWIGGLRAGLWATAVSTLLVWYFFIPSEGSFDLPDSRFILPMLVFIGMGLLFTLVHERLRAFTRQVEEELVAVRAVNAELEIRVRDRLEELAASRELIQQSQARMAGIVGSAMDAIISMNSDQVIILFNVAAEAMFRCPAAEALGQPLDRFMPKRFRESHRRDIQDFGLTGVSSRTVRALGTLSGVRADGEEFPIEASISQVEVAGQKTYTVILRDITERQRAEEAVSKLNAELDQRVIQRTAELEVANQELEAFSYSVSHDLRAPLRAVDGFSRAVLDDYGPLLPEEGQRYLNVIQEGAQKMGQLIDDLLTFSRLSRVPLSKRPINTRTLVLSALEELVDQRKDRQIDLRIGDLPPCDGDPALLKQVWVNLISNAIKYTRKREAAVVEIGCTQEPDRNVYFVRDNGTGFDMRFADKLFGVFQRLHLMEEYPGTGVGLAIVQRIIHRHGGRVWTQAAVDQGATFYFTLEQGSPP